MTAPGQRVLSTRERRRAAVQQFNRKGTPPAPVEVKVGTVSGRVAVSVNRPVNLLTWAPKDALEVAAVLTRYANELLEKEKAAAPAAPPSE